MLDVLHFYRVLLPIVIIQISNVRSFSMKAERKLTLSTHDDFK